MTKASFDTAVDRVLRIDSIVRQLDESIRLRAFEVLTRVYLEEERIVPATDHKPPAMGESATRLIEFAAIHASNVPADNVLTLVAWLFLYCGVSPFTAREITDFADFCGLSVPRRPDSTMRYASDHGNHLFARTSRGWSLTAYGEAYIRANYRI